MVTHRVPDILTSLRKRANLSLQALAEEMGYKGSSSIQRYFDGGDFKKQYLPLEVAQKFAQVLAGRGDPPISQVEVLRLAGVEKASGSLSLKPRVAQRTLPMLDFLELDVHAAGGHGAMDDAPEQAEIARWSMPRDLVKGHTSASAGAIRIITVLGDSQAPDFLPSDKIMVDTNDRTPSPPGAFVVWDGFALVVKLVEIVPGSKPPVVRLISKNPAYGTYERALDEVDIQGRVIGKWQWR